MYGSGPFRVWGFVTLSLIDTFRGDLLSSTTTFLCTLYTNRKLSLSFTFTPFLLYPSPLSLSVTSDGHKITILNFRPFDR